MSEQRLPELALQASVGRGLSNHELITDVIASGSKARYHPTSNGFFSSEVRTMRRIGASHFRSIIEAFAFILAATALLCGQSLGDVARENREKKAASPSATKVITNGDLGIDPDGDATAEDTSASSPKDAAASRKAAQQRAIEQRAAEQWKQKILTQKYAIADLQARVSALRSSIEFVDPNAYSNGYVYNRFQARQLERLKAMEAQLAVQKQKFEDMQEAARHAGMHTAVYDP